MRAEIETLERKNCLVCHSLGKPLYENLTDQLFSAPGNWNLSLCPKCRLIWLNPYPVPEDVGKLYFSYYTHQNVNRRILGNLFDKLTQDVYSSMGYDQGLNRSIGIGCHIPYFNEYVSLAILKVQSSWGNHLLDIGSGNGQYLNTMRSFGWKVEGVETDQKAADFARDKYTLKVHVGNLSECGIPSGSFDVITLNHVIEHVYDPRALLTECMRILKPGGRLVLLTPNSESLGYRLFGKNWRGLEAPRHMAIFSVTNLGELMTQIGFGTETLTSTARISRYLYSTSVHIRQGRVGIGGGGNRGYWLALRSYCFQVIEELVRLFNKKVGEEIFFVGTK